jgi:hypothetical protein
MVGMKDCESLIVIPIYQRATKPIVGIMNGNIRGNYDNEGRFIEADD